MPEEVPGMRECPEVTGRIETMAKKMSDEQLEQRRQASAAGAAAPHDELCTCAKCYWTARRVALEGGGESTFPTRDDWKASTELQRAVRDQAAKDAAKVDEQDMPGKANDKPGTSSANPVTEDQEDKDEDEGDKPDQRPAWYRPVSTPSTPESEAPLLLSPKEASSRHADRSRSDRTLARGSTAAGCRPRHPRRLRIWRSYCPPDQREVSGSSPKRPDSSIDHAPEPASLVWRL
jgi:hypothetical protein